MEQFKAAMQATDGFDCSHHASEVIQFVNNLANAVDWTHTVFQDLYN